MASSRKRIRLFHPDYDEPDMLFMLPADDGPLRDKTPYLVVHAAASAIANNRRDGWLSKAQDGSERIEETTPWLEAGDYFYHVPGSDKPWPVVPNFESWSFPHNQGAPSLWRQASEAEAAQASHGPPSMLAEFCRITNRDLPLQTAHIIPAAEKQWFGTNRMDQYGDIDGRMGDSVADTWANRMRLTCDAHTLWDSNKFTIIPNQQEEKDNRLEAVGWRTHRLNEQEGVFKYWHKIPLQPLVGRASEFLYARFVWDIFPLIQGFLHSGPPRRLAIYNQSLSKFEFPMLTKAERRVFTMGQGRGRSASPTKRQRSTQPDDPADSALSDNNVAGLPTLGKENRGVKRARLSSLSRSQDSAVCGIVDSKARSFDDEADFVQRHVRLSRSPDFEPSSEQPRGRRRERV
ncbi:Hypothetical protein R9X50_00407600 [Acrodontium crateriforme]|uniref:HNH nuclease domain-containing protein n=1 Tax=Acrodontium crateriforme TaxID=150365 RepID=A0AAQ3M4M3_9PEZI|nr:Hypothetical protein R9X50_00407600 [Acrodontium crateriforme]